LDVFHMYACAMHQHCLAPLIGWLIASNAALADVSSRKAADQMPPATHTVKLSWSMLYATKSTSKLAEEGGGQ